MTKDITKQKFSISSFNIRFVWSLFDIWKKKRNYAAYISYVKLNNLKFDMKLKYTYSQFTREKAIKIGPFVNKKCGFIKRNTKPIFIWQQHLSLCK